MRKAFLIPTTIEAPAPSNAYPMIRGITFSINQLIRVMESDIPVVCVPSTAAVINKKKNGNNPKRAINFPTPLGSIADIAPTITELKTKYWIELGSSIISSNSHLEINYLHLFAFQCLRIDKRQIAANFAELSQEDFLSKILLL